MDNGVEYANVMEAAADPPPNAVQIPNLAGERIQAHAVVNYVNINQLANVRVVSNEEFRMSPVECSQGRIVNDGRMGTFVFKLINRIPTIGESTAGFIYRCYPAYNPAWEVYAIDPLRFNFGVERTTRSVPNLETLGQCFAIWMNSAAPLNFGNYSVVVHLLLPFTALESFSDAYRKYLLNLDRNADIYNGVQNEVSIELDRMYPVAEGFDVRNAAARLFRTEAQAFYAIHIIILCFFKNFREIEHARRFMEQRINAFNQATNSYEITHDNFEELVNPALLSRISTTLSTYPLLRKTLLEAVVNSNKPEMDHTKMLAQGLGNTIPLFINAFIHSPNKTMAHIHPTILDEIQRFINAVNAINQQWGTMTPYIRVVAPDNHSLETNNWPNLAVAAYLFHYRTNMPTMRRFIISLNGVTINRLPQLLAKELEERHFFKNLHMDGGAAVIRHRLLIAGMGLDTNTFINNRPVFADDDEALEIFANAYRNLMDQRANQVQANAAAGLNAARGGA